MFIDCHLLRVPFWEAFIYNANIKEGIAIEFLDKVVSVLLERVAVKLPYQTSENYFILFFRLGQAVLYKKEVAHPV